MPHLAIGEPGIDVTRSHGVGEQRIRHVVEGLRQSARQCLPSCAPDRADDHCLSVVLAVGFPWTRRNRGIPHFWMLGIGGDCPAIMPVKTRLWLCPGGTGISTDGDARTGTAAFIDPVTMRDMKGEPVAIAQRPPAMPPPCVTATTAWHRVSS